MFEIGPDATHIAALTFADKTAVEFYFGEYETSEAAKERVCIIIKKNQHFDHYHAKCVKLLCPSFNLDKTIHHF
jgi:hypothetical protein